MLVPSKWYLRSDLRESFSRFSALLRWCGLRLIPSLLLLGELRSCRQRCI